MDPDISRWILIFLAQQKGIDCSIIKSLLSVLPLPNDDLLLKKLGLLCSILFQIDDDSSITEDMLKWLETIEELDSLTGASSITASLIRAYRSVAVECTARYLPGKVDKGSQYFDAVERIWRGRVRLMEQAGPDKRSGLLTEELLLWRTHLEAALSDHNVRSELLGVNVRTEAFKSLRAYLNEALEGSLPLLIQALANDIPSPEKLKGHVPVKTTRLPRLRRNRGVRIADPEELEIGASTSTAAVTQEPEALDAGCLVNDPLPDVHQVAKAPAFDKYGKRSNLDQDVNAAEEHEVPKSSYLVKDPLLDGHKETEVLVSDQHKNIPNLSQDVNAADTSLKENVETRPVVPETSKNQARKLPKSLMNRNNTAQTFEWEESEDGMEEKRANPDRKRKWNAVQEAALIEGVKKFSEGQWKLILNWKPDIFEGRSSTNLKDKWRNMCHSSLRRI